MRKILAASVLALCLTGATAGASPGPAGSRTSTNVVEGNGMRLVLKLTEARGFSLLKCTVSAPGATTTGISRCRVTSSGGGGVGAPSVTSVGTTATTYGVGKLGTGIRSGCIVAHATTAGNMHRSTAWCGVLAPPA